MCGIELPETGLCGACIQTRPLLDRTVCAYKYTYPIDSTAINIKYKQSLTYIPALVSRLCDQIAKFSCVKIDLLLPVPMPRTRMVIRGMNQATVIARMVSRELNIPVDYFGLKGQDIRRLCIVLTPGNVIKTRETPLPVLGLRLTLWRLLMTSSRPGPPALRFAPASRPAGCVMWRHGR